MLTLKNYHKFIKKEKPAKLFIKTLLELKKNHQNNTVIITITRNYSEKIAHSDNLTTVELEKIKPIIEIFDQLNCKDKPISGKPDLTYKNCGNV